MPSPDYIVTNVAGCGAMLKEYPELFHPAPQGEEARQAAELARKSRDVCELVAALMPPNWAPQGQPGGLKRVERTVAVHDACHLAHAQRVAGAARSLLALVPGLRCVPLTESDHCCGAAGTYNLTQPEMAQTLAARKLDHLARAGVEECVTGNLGCAMHLAAEARRRGQALRLTHPIALLHEAMLG
jgi:glycolate oxidase iron-sulfur subunit